MAKTQNDITTKINNYLDPNGSLTLEDLLKEAQNDPVLAKRLKFLGITGDPIYGQLQQKYGAAFDAGINALGSIVGLSQTRQAKQYINKNIKPTLPQTPGLDPALMAAISKANQFYSNPQASGIVEPYRSMVADAYASGLKQAASASGGQAGAYAGMAQGLYNQRLKQSAQLPSMLAQVQQGYGDLYSRLLGVQQQGQSDINWNRLYRANALLGQYNTENAYNRSLLAQGQQNFYAGLAGQKSMIDNWLVPALIGNDYTGNKVVDNQNKENVSNITQRLINNGNYLNNSYLGYGVPYIV